MIAYYNWINALYMVSSATDKLAKNSKEMKWEEMKTLQDYLTNLTTHTIKTMKDYCVSSNAPTASETNKEQKETNDQPNSK